MRSTTTKALLATVITSVLIGGFTAPSMAGSKDDLERERKGVNGKIESAEGEVAQSTKQLRVAQAKLESAQNALSGARAQLGQTRGELAVARAQEESLRAKLAETEAQLEVAAAKYDEGKADLATSEKSVEAFTVESVQEGDSGLRAFNGLLTGDSPSDFTEQMSINSSVTDAQVATMQDLDASRVVLKLKRDEVEKLRDRVEKQRAQAVANVEAKKSLEAAAVDQTRQVTTLVREQRTAKASADDALAADLAQLKELENERARIQNKLAALAAKDVKSGGKGVGGDGGGTLSYPVSAPITSQYGMRRHPITGVYKLHDGTDFGAPCGTPIRAAASGTIIEQYFNAGYGNRVLVNNGVKRGVSVVTTYNHLSRYAKGVGSKVSRGDVIGYVGTTGYSTGCHLHFMVLANGATQNPMGWL